MVPRQRHTAVRSAGRGVRALLMAPGLLALSGCNVELFGGPPPWPQTQHAVGHLLVFVVALTVAVLLVMAIVELIVRITELVRRHAHPRGLWSHP